MQKAFFHETAAATTERDAHIRDRMSSGPRPMHGEGSDLEDLLAGDRSAFEKLVRRESPGLYHVILRIVRDADEAESVLQETFLQAYQNLRTFRRESRFTTWLYAIGINQARASLRKTRRYSTLEEADLERLQPPFIKGMYEDRYESWDPSKLAEKAERKRLVHEAIERLPADYRTIITLRDIQEFSTAEAAAMMNISEGAARVRLHRARQALRSLLDEYLR